MDNLSYKEIENTFFSKSAKGAGKKKKPKKTKLFPVFIVSILLCALGLGMVIIRASGKKSEAKIANQPSDIPYSESILKGGKLNYSKIKEIYFKGGAKEKSALLNFSVKLVKPKASPDASLKIVLNESVNFGGKFLLLSAKTVTGEREIKLILTDTEKRSYEIPNIRILPDWALKSIYLKKKDNFDPRRTKEIEIAFGRGERENTRNSAVYIKDIIIRTKDRR